MINDYIYLFKIVSYIGGEGGIILLVSVVGVGFLQLGSSGFVKQISDIVSAATAEATAGDAPIFSAPSLILKKAIKKTANIRI